jgi:tRNA uridine 5-carboxymethylaminomethyl modification enzyme
LNDSPKAAWLRRPESKIGDLLPWIEEKLGGTPVNGVLTTVETEIKYAGYVDQQRRQVERLQSSSDRRIPENFSFVGIPGLSREVSQKLSAVSPATLGQAARIPGVTPAAIAILDLYLNLATR